jgi:hypothetical protein
MDILQLVDKLEALVNKGKHVPLTASIVVNEDEFLELVDQLRIAVPEEVKSARRVQQERTRILSEAQDEADRVVEDARKRIGSMIDEHEFVQTARTRAEQILRQAEEQAVAMRQGADDYVAQVLTQLDEQLAEAQRVVRNGLASVGGPEH